MNAENKKILTSKEMEEMLPDYVFGRLSGDEADSFEYSLQYYPEYQEEVKQVREVFQKLDATDFNNEVNSRSKNLSVKFNYKLEKGSQRRFSGSYVTRIVMPTLGLAAIVTYFIITGINPRQNVNPVQGTQKSISSGPMFFKPADAMLLIDSTVDNNEIRGMVANPGASVNERISNTIPQNNEDEINDLYNDMFADNIKNLDSKTLHKIFEANGIHLNDMMEDLNNIDETDFQIILKALENEDFKS